MALTHISGSLYNAKGEIVNKGKLYLTLQQDMISADGTKVAPFTVSVDISTLAGPAYSISLDVYATVGATPSGLSYFVEFDPDPTDTSKPARSKNGYWSNFWAVPSGSVTVAQFTSALRGQPSNNYVPMSAPSLTGLPVYADNAAATAGGLAAGRVYRTSTGVLMVRY